MNFKTKIIILTFSALSFTQVISANSSWHWVTISPYRILPLAILLTLAIEILGTIKFNQWKNRGFFKICVVFILANIMSFLAPYLYRAYRFIPTSGGYDIGGAFNKGPFYMIMLGYLLLTLIVELPTTYLTLKKDVKKPLRLLLTVTTLNIATTLTVALLERVLCKGIW